MDKAIGALQQRFTEPSADEIQQDSMCSICLNDYEGEDRPVRLPCGHVFGKECIIAWSRGITPTGRHNGCPYCRAELLPPSVYSRSSALRDLLSDIWQALSELLGGPRGIGLAAVLWIVGACAKYIPKSMIAEYVGLGSDVLVIWFMTKKMADIMGWRQALYLLVMVVISSAFRALWQSIFS